MTLLGNSDKMNEKDSERGRCAAGEGETPMEETNGTESANNDGGASQEAAEEEQSLNNIYFGMVFDENRRAPSFELASDDAIEPLYNLQRYLKHMEPDKSYLVLDDYMLAEVLKDLSMVVGENDFPVGLNYQPMSPDEQVELMGKLYVDGYHNLPEEETDEDGCVGYVRIHMGGRGVWWLDNPIIFVTYKIPFSTEEISIILRKPHPAYEAKDAFTDNSAFWKHVKLANCLFFDFAEMHPEASLAREKERAKAREDGVEVVEDDEESETIPLLDELLKNLDSSLDEVIKDKELHRFMKQQLSFTNSELVDMITLPIIRDILYARTTANGQIVYDDSDDEEYTLDGKKRKRKSGGNKGARKTPKTGLNYVSKKGEMAELASEVYLTPLVEDSFATHFPTFLGHERYKRLQDEGKIREPRVKLPDHGKKLVDLEFGGQVVLGEGALRQIRYEFVKVNWEGGYSLKIRPGQFVAFQAKDGGFKDDYYFIKVCYICQLKRDLAAKIQIHGPLFRIRGYELIGPADRNPEKTCAQMDELVYMNSCVGAPVDEVVDTVDIFVEESPSFAEWQAMGGKSIVARPELDGKYLCRSKYVGPMRWIHLTGEEKEVFSETSTRSALCVACDNKALEKEKMETLFESKTRARLNGIWFSAGDCVMFDPKKDPTPAERMDFMHYPCDYEENQMSLKQYKSNPKLYPEMGMFKDSPLEDPTLPNSVHRIEEFDPSGSRIHLRTFYRTSDVDHGSLEENRKNRCTREVYWSYEKNWVTKRKFADGFIRQCYVAGCSDLVEGEKWCHQGPNRLCCRYIFELENEKPIFSTLEDQTELLGAAAKRAPDYASSDRHLTGLELFCGAGGLARGMHQVGIQTTHANDLCRPAGEAFAKNFPNSIFHLQDVNNFLLDCDKHQNCKSTGADCQSKACKTIAHRGDFNVISGGPPCQGFSKMNRYPKTQNSTEKNTGVSSFISSVDFFRPEFCVMENVASLAQHSSILRAPLQDMGYQLQIYVANAVAYGVAESRRRIFFVAAAPGMVLPEPPVPLYSSTQRPLWFPDGAIQHDYRQGNGEYHALLSQLTAYDAISDLEQLKVETQNTRQSGARPDAGELKIIQLPEVANTMWQREIRSEDNTTTDVETKAITPLETARVRQVPFPTREIPDPNWRFIANETYTINMNGATHKYEPLLPYVQDKTRKNIWRWYCPTCELKKKNSSIKCVITPENKRIIPVCLAHMSEKNPWTNCYGRVSYDCQFMTISCADGLTNKTGKLLHPHLHRMFTVRELARGQGFPDNHVFVGNHFSTKVSQVGNAVPPPLAKEIGRTIIEAIQRTDATAAAHSASTAAVKSEDVKMEPVKAET